MIRGYEKFWAALLGGGMATAVTILAQLAVSRTGAFEAPGPDEIQGAISGIVTALFAAAGAYLATNTNDPEEPPK